VARINHTSTAKLIAFFLLLFFASLAAHAQKPASPKIQTFMRDATFPYTKVKPDIYLIHFQGKALKKFNIVVTQGEGLILLFAVVASKHEYKPSTELGTKLLKAAWNADRVKIGLDDEDAIVARIDLSLRLTDKRDFDQSVDQLAAAADQTFEAIKPFLIPVEKVD
jgi:hypothetical protein